MLYGCVIKAQRKLRRMEGRLRENRIVIPDGVIHVHVRLSTGAADSWTKFPEGTCGLNGCCGKRWRGVAGEITYLEETIDDNDNV